MVRVRVGSENQEKDAIIWLSESGVSGGIQAGPPSCAIVRNVICSILAAICLGESLSSLTQGHSRAVLSELAVTKDFPSGLNAALLTAFSWRRGSPMALPVAASHTRAVLSSLAVTTNFPSGLKAALLTSFSWRRGSPTGLPVAASDSRAVLSELAVTKDFPSGLNAALLTAFSWRRGSPMALPVAASHTRAVPSSLAVTTNFPSGLYACAVNRLRMAQGLSDGFARRRLP